MWEQSWDGLILTTQWYLEEKGSVHVEVAKFRASGSDLRKFYVHSGTMTLMLKAESSSERSAWLNALQSERTAAKTPKTPLPKTPATPAVATVLATSDHIREDVKRFMDLMRANEASDELLDLGLAAKLGSLADRVPEGQAGVVIAT